jgi:hypothetical protein
MDAILDAIFAADLTRDANWRRSFVDRFPDPIRAAVPSGADEQEAIRTVLSACTRYRWGRPVLLGVLQEALPTHSGDFRMIQEAIATTWPVPA